jgi:hypothetical protein
MFWPTKRTTGRRASRRKLSFEKCEDRRLLAVTTSLSGGTLTITGDGDADDIAIVGTTGGEITVTGRNGTSVDGVINGSAVVPGVTADLLADFGDGDNVINVDNVFLAGRLDLDTGDGNDRVVFGATGVVTSGGICSVNTSDGNDSFRAEDYKVFIADQLTVHVGRGNDFASLVGASAITSVEVSGGGFEDGRNDYILRGITSGGRLRVFAQKPINNVAIFISAASDDLEVFGGSGQNSIYVDTCFSAGNISVLSASSNTGFFPRNHPPPVAAPFNVDATITVARCQATRLFVNTLGDANPRYFSGDDTIFIYGNNLVGPSVASPGAHVLSVATGDGNDQVSASYNVVLGVAFAGLGELNDTLTLAGNVVTDTAIADGGTGGNLLNLFGNQFAGTAFSNF